MKTKLLIGALLLSSSAYAQESTQTTTASALTFGGSVLSGVRSNSTGSMDGTGTGATVGPFIRPSLDLGWKNNSVSFSGNYNFETTGARGFGKNTTKAFGDNIYFKHNPNLFFTGKFNETFGATLLADLNFKTYAGPQKENVSELVLEPMLTAKLNDRVSFGAGYSLFRADNFDAATGRGASLDEGSKGFFSKDITEAKFSIENINQAITAGTTNLVPAVMNRHTGIVEVKAKLAETLSLRTYAWAGRIIFNQDKSAGGSADRYTYRINNDLKWAATKDLALNFRYRLTIDHQDDTKDPLTGAHTGRVIASYKLTKTIALDMENTAKFSQKVLNKSKTTYENENYLGMSYNF